MHSEKIDVELFNRMKSIMKDYHLERMAVMLVLDCIKAKEADILDLYLGINDLLDYHISPVALQHILDRMQADEIVDFIFCDPENTTTKYFLTESFSKGFEAFEQSLTGNNPLNQEINLN